MAHKRDKPGKSCCKCVLQKTMKGADKAIVAKSFGKWQSSSLRPRTMEKPDELSEESKEDSLSNCTCEAPRLGQKPVGKSAVFPYFVSLGLFFLVAILIITVATCFVFFLPLTLWPAISGEQTNHIVGQENSFWGKVCLRWYSVARKRQSKK